MAERVPQTLSDRPYMSTHKAGPWCLPLFQYIHFRAMLLTCDNLRRHPITHTDHSSSLRMRGIRDLRAEAEITEDGASQGGSY